MEFEIDIENKYKGGLEYSIAIKLHTIKANFEYETVKIQWQDLCYRTYKPDFILDNGIIIEAKGHFTAAHRRKHIEVKKQHPNLDIRFVFGNSKNKLYKGSNTTYAQWCVEQGFLYHDRIIPEAWLKEKGKNEHPKFIKCIGGTK
jgi:hypothetical protein|tara:strand:- start:6629 stop:7063 length:435 start_codon:yes stop_codon:yes gene_type:complete